MSVRARVRVRVRVGLGLRMLHLKDCQVARFAGGVDGAEGYVRDRAATACDVHRQRRLCDLRAPGTAP